MPKHINILEQLRELSSHADASNAKGGDAIFVSNDHIKSISLRMDEVEQRIIKAKDHPASEYRDAADWFWSMLLGSE